MQFLNSGGSLGTITGAPGVCDALPLAATYIQWLKAAVVIGFPDMSATESPGTPLPHAERLTASTKKAPSARMNLNRFIAAPMVAIPSRRHVSERVPDASSGKPHHHPY